MHHVSRFTFHAFDLPVKAANTDLNAHLSPGERVLWRGKPDRAAFVRRTWPLSIFGLVLLVSAVSYELVVFTTDAPDFLALVGVPFFFAALYMLVGHYFVTSREWQNTEYLITENRLLVRHGALSPDLRVYSLAGLPHTVVEMRGKDVGNILFEPQQGQGYGPWPGYQTMWPYTPGYLLGLLYVRDPHTIQGLLERGRPR
jgi:hypothetical protein